MKAVVKSDVTGPESSRFWTCHHTEAPCRRYPWYRVPVLLNHFKL